MRVLVVDSEWLLANAIAQGLRRHHAVAVTAVYDGRGALERGTVYEDDSPVVQGADVSEHLTESGASARILLLTAATAAADRLGLGR
jgi:DNA-binding response OmpR family regulator